jgi:hypothetical protein
VRRLLAICVGVLALTCGLTIAQVAGPIALVNAQTPETEPNDDFETANALGEANISAQIIDGESDFYQIDANTTDALSLKVSNMTGGAAVEIRLYNSDRDELETDFRDRNGDLSITRKIPETGTYYVEIDGTRSQTTTEYTLDIDRVTPSENDQFAPNDGFTSAATITKEFSDARIVGGESDFYQIDANATDALSLEVIDISGNGGGGNDDVALRLYDSNRDTLETDTTNRAFDLSITRKLPETGTYYVEVDGTSSQTTTDYTLQSNQTGSDSAPETENPVIVGDNPAADLNGDGKLEDVNGDGQANFDDAIELAFNIGAASNNAESFDFDDDGDVDFDDAIALAFAV